MRVLRDIGRDLGLGTACAVIAVSLGACSAPGYGHDRLMDLTDVIDVGYGQGMGLGVFARATLWLEAGVGLSSTEDMREWYGRRSARQAQGVFVGMVAFTGTGNYSHGSPPLSSIGVLFVNVLAVLDDEPPEVIDRFQVGGRIYLPFVNVALFVNLGEIVDLCAGLAGADPAADDGIAKGESL